MPLVKHYECFEYQYANGENPGYCELWVYECPGGETLVVAAEPVDGYEGPSVTNSIERIASEVVRRLRVHFTHFVEYYPPTNGLLQRTETFDLVHFHRAEGYRRDYMQLIFDDPEWTSKTREQIEAVTGCRVMTFEAQR